MPQFKKNNYCTPVGIQLRFKQLKRDVDTKMIQ